MRRTALLLGALLAVSAAAEVGRRSPADFRRRAPVSGEVAPGGAHAVALSAEVVAALGEGRELRLFDAGGREIPSLVHTETARHEATSRPVRIFNTAWSEDGTQTLSVELEGTPPEPVNEFVFEIGEPQYLARVRVEGSDDGRSWRIVRDGLHLIRHDVDEQGIEYHHDALRIPTSRYPFFRLTLRGRLQSTEPFRPLAIRGVAVRQRVERGGELELPLSLSPLDLPGDRDPRHVHLLLDLGREHLGVDRVVLEIDADEYARPASLWEWSQERGRRTRRLASGVLFRFGADAHAELSGFRTDSRHLALTIDHGDDEPVPLVGARASRPRQELRFLAPDAVALPISLYADPDAPRAPRYDLARRLRERKGLRFEPLALRRLEPNALHVAPGEPQSERIPYLLALLVVPLVAGLGWYVARTIRRGVPPEDVSR
jgi:hypothetical protein